jgi:hypothetical protein
MTTNILSMFFDLYSDQVLEDPQDMDRTEWKEVLSSDVCSECVYSIRRQEGQVALLFEHGEETQ